MPRVRKSAPAQVPGAPAGAYPGMQPSAQPTASASAPPTPGRPPAARQPVRVPTGGEYGSAQESAQAQRTAPLPQPGMPVVGPGEDPRQALMARAIEQAHAMPFDGVPIGADSQRPGEPLTAGMDTGPGVGSEVLRRPQGTSVQETLAALARATGDGDIGNLADIAGQMGA